MPAERYFHSSPLLENSTIVLEEQEFHHLINVMRAREGEKIELVNGQGRLAFATVAQIEKRKALLKIDEVHVEAPSSKSLILAQAIPRLNRLEFILEKGTELGMSEIWLFPSAQSEKKQFSENQLARFQFILISAMKQCGRLYLPKLVLADSIQSWQIENQTCFFGDVRETAPLIYKFSDKTVPPKDCFICIGPESGLMSGEVSLLEQKGFKGIKLHDHILRTDTAAIAALSLLSYWQLNL